MPPVFAIAESYVGFPVLLVISGARIQFHPFSKKLVAAFIRTDKLPELFLFILRTIASPDQLYSVRKPAVVNSDNCNISLMISTL
jgi:hypothetical protein